jgi:hypothetical protein
MKRTKITGSSLFETAEGLGKQAFATEIHRERQSVPNEG